MRHFFCPEKENDSQAHNAKAAMTPVWCFVVVGLLAASLMGCGAITDASGNSVAEFATSDFSNSPDQSMIDAGIVFADEASYLCVPLSRLGISDSDEVLSVQTSCECTRPSVVQFDESPSKTARALRIDFRPEPSTSDSKHAPSNLAVKVTLRFTGGRTTVVTIQFLHTIRASGGEFDTITTP